jgi:hypothetical protein
LLRDVEALYSELAICKNFSEDLVQLAAAVPLSMDKREVGIPIPI